MNPYDPVLDLPQLIEYDGDPGAIQNRLANHDLHFYADANSDLTELSWLWADERYVKSIRMHIGDPHGEELMPLVTRLYPGYQETILGNEGMIISKRLAALLGSHYDRTVLWTLECQAEGDRLLRLDIEVDWGEPLTQRIVDGLLVAQRNPSSARGIYKQRNADRTCVFGNPLGRPSSYEFDDNGLAKLSYYVLVNGIVDVSLLLTVSDVGEQVAWNGFLALRDTEREFEDSVKRWEDKIKTGRLWTPDPQLNRAVQAGRLLCMRHIQRMRTGYSPPSREMDIVPTLVACTDAFDRTMSRNLLAHLRRVAEKSEGRLPSLLPIHPKDPVPDSDADWVANNHAYMQALHQHLDHHPDNELLQEHYEAVQLCAESLVATGNSDGASGSGSQKSAVAQALRVAAELADKAGDSANVARWRSEAEASEYEPAPADEKTHVKLDDWEQRSGWLFEEGQPWGFEHPQDGIELAGSAVWSVSGLKWQDGSLWVYPNRIAHLRWWALVDLPIEEDGRITLVWDGSKLHTTVPVQSPEPVVHYDKIVVREAGEHDFNLHFDMIHVSHEQNGGRKQHERVIDTFYPEFDRAADE